MGNYTSSNIYDEQKRLRTFSLEIDKAIYPLFVEVVPYRNGSKVIYSTNIKYSLDSENQPSITKETINKIHEKIQTVVNN